MLSVKLTHNGSRTPLARFILNPNIEMEDKRQMLLGAYIYFNNITTLVTSYDQWLALCKQHRTTCLNVKTKKHLRTGYDWTTAEDALKQFDNVPRDGGWYTFNTAKDIDSILSTSHIQTLADVLGIPLLYNK